MLSTNKDFAQKIPWLLSLHMDQRQANNISWNFYSTTLPPWIMPKTQFKWFIPLCETQQKHPSTLQFHTTLKNTHSKNKWFTDSSIPHSPIQLLIILSCVPWLAKLTLEWIELITTKQKLLPSMGLNYAIPTY